MTTPVVVDASAGVEVLLGTERGKSLVARVPRPVVEWVPEIYFAEVAAALRRAEMHGRLSGARAAVALDRLLAAPVRRVQVRSLLDEAWALRHNVVVNDALYVVLARHLGAPLVTADVALARAPSLGVEVITP
ncbi:MAG TPA: type II toxin-antitoxin system VapC family toxin [Acidimicrobiales bacterium]|nr:type II toxin-antitoxin system VapC family toxin [Acidimicrobiales bacterium]